MSNIRQEPHRCVTQQRIYPRYTTRMGNNSSTKTLIINLYNIMYYTYHEMFNNNIEYHTIHCKVNCKVHTQQCSLPISRLANVTQGLNYITYDSTDLYRYYYKLTKFLKLYICSNSRTLSKSIQIMIYLIQLSNLLY